MSKSKAAFEFSAQKLGKEKLYFWTFTFAEVLDIKATRKRWNHLLTLLRRRYPKLCGLRAFELHEEHGLHVHLVTNAWIDVNEARAMAKKAGWGRIHVKRIPAEKASYLGKYLTKENRVSRALNVGGYGPLLATGFRQKSKMSNSRVSTEAFCAGLLPLKSDAKATLSVCC